MFKRPSDPDPKPTPPLHPSPPWELWDGKRALGHWSICTGTAAAPALHQGEQQAIGRCSNAPLTPIRNPHHRCTQTRRGNCGMGRRYRGLAERAMHVKMPWAVCIIAGGGGPANKQKTHNVLLTEDPCDASI
jgi:hypothetical protein